MYNIQLKNIKIPELKEVKSFRNNYYMTDSGDNFFNNLIYLYEHSSIHNSFINNFVEKVIGSGLVSDSELDENVIDSLDLNDILMKITLDYAIYGGFAIEVIWNTLHTKIHKINYIDFSKIRSGYVDKDTDEVELYYYSYDWKAYHKNIQIFPKFNEDENSDNKQLFYYKGHHPGSDIYPRPSYLGGLKYIYIDVELSKYYYNLVKNNFVTNTIIKIPNGMDPEKQIAFEQGIKENFTSSENAGSIAIVYGDGENAVEMLEFGKGSDDQKYQWLTQQTTDQLVISHRIPNPIIAGVRIPGTLGGTQEMKDAEIIYNKNVIYPSRNTIMKQLDKLNKYFSNPLNDVEIKDVSLFDNDTIEK